MLLHQSLVKQKPLSLLYSYVTSLKAPPSKVLRGEEVLSLSLHRVGIQQRQIFLLNMALIEEQYEYEYQKEF